MAAPVPRGNLPGPLFPRLLLGLSVKMNLDGEAVANRVFINGLNVLSNRFDAKDRFLINPAAD